MASRWIESIAGIHGIAKEVEFAIVLLNGVIMDAFAVDIVSDRMKS